MKAQPRLAGGRRKLGRNGFRSDIPRECADPPEYLRDLRDLRSPARSRAGCSSMLLVRSALVRSALLTTMSASRQVDPTYPGTAVARMLASRERVRSLKPDELSGDWDSVRKRLLWAAGLKDLTNVAPGAGYTGHAFNDANHCDATTMLGDVSHNLNGVQRETRYHIYYMMDHTRMMWTSDPSPNARHFDP